LGEFEAVAQKVSGDFSDVALRLAAVRDACAAAKKAAQFFDGLQVLPVRSDFAEKSEKTARLRKLLETELTGMKMPHRP
jgi:hypothetical protein